MPIQEIVTTELLAAMQSEPSRLFPVLIICDQPCDSLTPSIKKLGIVVENTINELQLITAKLSFEQLAQLEKINGVKQIELDATAQVSGSQ